MAEGIDVEKCNFRHFSEVQKPRYLDLDLGSSESHMVMHNACGTTSVPNGVTLSSSNAEIWPFEFLVVWTFREI